MALATRVVNFNDVDSIKALMGDFQRLRGMWRVTWTLFRTRRSDRQNRYWHPCFVEPFREAMAEQGQLMDHEQAHNALVTAVVGNEWADPKTGATFSWRPHTSEMDTAEFNRMLDLAAQLLVEMFGIIVPDPSEYHETDEPKRIGKAKQLTRSETA